MNHPEPFTDFHKRWALLTAGTPDHFNSMTIGWGAMGTIWSRSTITVYVRPDRYTWNFIKDSEYFTVSLFPEEYRNALTVMGRTSGRDTDKPKEAGLTPVSCEGCVSYAEASETYLCRKIYMAQLEYDQCPDYAKAIYQNGIEPHYMIIGELISPEF